MALTQLSRQQGKLILNRQAKAIMEKPRPVLTVKPKTLHLPKEIKLPGIIKIGSKFKHEFRLFEYVGERIENIGDYRKRKSSIWKTPCVSCKGHTNTYLSVNAETVKPDALKIECADCLTLREKPQFTGPSSAIVWNDEKLKTCGGWRA